MKKIYIAGKITGDPDYKAKFDWAKEWLSGYGQSVMSPADLPAGMKQGDYMRVCLAMVDSADEVHVLPGSRDSKGTQIEILYAQYIGKEVVLMGDEMYEVPPIDQSVFKVFTENERVIFCAKHACKEFCKSCNIGKNSDIEQISCQQYTAIHPDLASEFMRKEVE